MKLQKVEWCHIDSFREIFDTLYDITLLTTRFLHKKYGQYKHENLDKFTSQYSYTNYYKYLSLNKKKIYHFKSYAAVVVKLQLLVVVVI